jgi:DNA-binding NarL/FixJ family response regulator
VSDDLPARILDELELGVLVCDARASRIELANAAAKRFLQSLDATGALCPSLQAAILGALSRDAAAAGFTAATPVPLPTGQRLFIRVRRLGDSVLATIHRDLLRERELLAVMQQRFQLNWRELQIVALIRGGASNADVAQKLEIAVGTVKLYVNRIFKSVGVRSRCELVAKVEQLAREEQDAPETETNLRVRNR